MIFGPEEPVGPSAVNDRFIVILRAVAIFAWLLIPAQLLFWAVVELPPLADHAELVANLVGAAGALAAAWVAWQGPLPRPVAAPVAAAPAAAPAAPLRRRRPHPRPPHGARDCFQ